MSNIKYQSTLPKKRMGAGALFFDSANRLLLVEPSYKPTWEIPGGIVEENESPKDCCKREVLEELGLNRTIGRLLCVDYNQTTEQRLESLMFIFNGGVLSAADIESICLPGEELLSYQFFQKDSLPENLSVTLKKRILAAWKNRDLPHDESKIYMEEAA